MKKEQMTVCYGSISTKLGSKKSTDNVTKMLLQTSYQKGIFEHDCCIFIL